MQDIIQMCRSVTLSNLKKREEEAEKNLFLLLFSYKKKKC
jgi:hypothetical protein